MRRQLDIIFPHAKPHITKLEIDKRSFIEERGLFQTEILRDPISAS